MRFGGVTMSDRPPAPPRRKCQHPGCDNPPLYPGMDWSSFCREHSGAASQERPPTDCPDPEHPGGAWCRDNAQIERASQERPQPDECVFAECAEHGGGYCERHDHHSMADPFGQPFGHPGVAQERPQPPFRTDSDLLDAYQDCIEREEAREAKPDLWDDIYGEDGTAAQERPSIDVDARRLFDLLWDERGALDAGIEGFSPNRYRSAARRILWRLSSPVPVEPGE
jgi:hypothetical protein